MVLLDSSTKHFKWNINSIKSTSKNRRGVKKVSIILIAKQDKDSTRKNKSQIIFMNRDTKILKKITAN